MPLLQIEDYLLLLTLYTTQIIYNVSSGTLSLYSSIYIYIRCVCLCVSAKNSGTGMAIIYKFSG